METPFDDCPFFVEPNEQVRQDLLRLCRRKAGANVFWISKILPETEVSDDIMQDKFFVEIVFSSPQARPISLTFVVNGGSKIEDVCSRSFSMLRANGRLGYDPLSCVFHTVGEKPLLVPSGAFLGELYQTNPTPNGTGVQLSATLVEHKHGCPFIISPGDDFVLGHWMTGILVQ